MYYSRRSLLALLAAGAACATAARTAGATAAQTGGKDLITMPIGGEGLHYFALHVAQALGLFDQANLAVHWVDVGSGSKQIAAVMGGSADITPTSIADLLKGVQRSLPLVAVASNFDAYPTILTLSNTAVQRLGITAGMNIDEKVKRVAAGKLKIGISSPGSSTDTMIRAVLKKRGFNPDSVVTLQPLGSGASMFAAFERGAIDGFVSFSPFPDLAIVKKLGVAVINPLSGEVPEMRHVPYTVMVTSRPILKARRPVIERFVVAYSKALALCSQKPDEARRAVESRFPDMNREALAMGIKEQQPHVPSSPVIPKEDIAETVAWLNLTEHPPLNVHYAQAVDPTVAEDALKLLSHP